jgi:hypothetical protein
LGDDQVNSTAAMVIKDMEITVDTAIKGTIKGTIKDTIKDTEEITVADIIIITLTNDINELMNHFYFLLMNFMNHFYYLITENSH